MTMIYDTVPFVKIVQIFYYELIMGICGKIFIITLHNANAVHVVN